MSQLTYNQEFHKKNTTYGQAATSQPSNSGTTVATDTLLIEREHANVPQRSVRHPQQRPRNEQVAQLQPRQLSASASIRVRLSSFLRAPTRHISKG